MKAAFSLVLGAREVDPGSRKPGLRQGVATPTEFDAAHLANAVSLALTGYCSLELSNDVGVLSLLTCPPVAAMAAGLPCGPGLEAFGQVSQHLPLGWPQGKLEATPLKMRFFEPRAAAKTKHCRGFRTLDPMRSEFHLLTQAAATGSRGRVKFGGPVGRTWMSRPQGL